MKKIHTLQYVKVINKVDSNLYTLSLLNLFLTKTK